MAFEKQESADDVLKRLWIRKSLELQKAAMMRARNIEIPGSEVYGFRIWELEFLDKLIQEYTK